MPADLAFDVVERADTVESFAGDARFVGRPDIVEGAPQVRPTGRFTELP